MAQSFYEVLGVKRTATTEEIEAACLRLGEQNHPDNNKGMLDAAIRFKQIEQAYEVLSNPDKRAEYDRSLSQGAQPASSGIEQKRKAPVVLWGTVGVGAILVVVATWFLSSGERSTLSPETASPSKSAVIGDTPEIREATIKFLKSLISSSLKDPSSTQFRETRLYVTTLQLESGKRVVAGTRVLCGEINGKNSFGAYVGFRPFISSAVIRAEDGTVIEDSIYTSILDPDPANDLLRGSFKKNYAELCRDRQAENIKK